MSVSGLLIKASASFVIALAVVAVTFELSTVLVKPAAVGDAAYPLSDVPVAAAPATAAAPAAAAGKPAAPAADAVPADLTADQLSKADAVAGQKIAAKCMVCHNFPKGTPAKVGPNLWGIINNTRAHMDGFAYSDAVAHLGGTWTVQNIARFIYKPKAYISGTKMGFGGLPDPQDRANVLAFLNQNSDAPVDLVKEGAKPSEAADGGAK
jgi:cytochrome c